MASSIRLGSMAFRAEEIDQIIPLTFHVTLFDGLSPLRRTDNYNTTDNSSGTIYQVPAGKRLVLFHGWMYAEGGQAPVHRLGHTQTPLAGNDVAISGAPTRTNVWGSGTHLGASNFTLPLFNYTWSYHIAAPGGSGYPTNHAEEGTGYTDVIMFPPTRYPHISKENVSNNMYGMFFGIEQDV